MSHFNGRYLIARLGAAAVLLMMTASVGFDSDADAQDSTFTIVVLPDTQSYLNSARPGLDHYFASQVDWAVAQRASRDIVFVSHVGDVVENSQNQTEWNLARPIFDTLHGSGLPFGVAAGNHDMLYQAVSPAFSSVLPASRFAGDPWYGGGYEDNLNSYQVLSHEGHDLLFLHIRYLRYASIEGTLDWARQVLDDHPNHMAFVTTHEFAGADGNVLQTRLQDEVLAPTCNVIAVFSGHIHAQSRGSFNDECGRPVPHMLSNYQHWADGGLGFLRTVEVDTASMVLDVRTYSPTLDRFVEDSDNQFAVQAAAPTGGPVTGERVTVVPFGSQWRYYDDGAAPGQWSQPGFDDGDWNRGWSELGFGDGDESTIIDRSEPGGARIAAAYFRTTFEVEGATSSALLRMVADDGAVVWLNGERVVNDNMTEGPVSYATLALTGRWGGAERAPQIHVLPANRFVSGTNTIAIEVHQRDPGSSDLSFDAQVEVVRDQNTPAPPPPLPTPTPPPTPTPLPTPPPPPQGPIGDVTVIEAGASWRFFDGGTTAADWHALGFDDAGWSVGTAEFGFGDGDESTTLTRVLDGRGLHTAYFRTQFDIVPGSRIDAAVLDMVADDGAVVWVNGQRVVNDNMTSQAVDYWTFASSGRWGSAERDMTSFVVPNSAFSPGTNVVAVEVHQRTEWSSDLTFDAELTLTLS